MVDGDLVECRQLQMLAQGVRVDIEVAVADLLAAFAIQAVKRAIMAEQGDEL